ncbi:DUF2142 domain-containing protein [Frigoribacterium sp. CFBP 8754]|uniref:DUF2142 domain-containing protein n=1 Tax=Frigoribacterium sp. CFBP 8754 TaxID=2775290 RepID=UPI00178521E4|nr:DUF2142 domain-containing protein [Frigoribacterium sp. CFBP 8754]MBD8658991.1 DUF2142 domain-containing protein [Frigoribacterium sp. CFBP 8754]
MTASLLVRRPSVAFLAGWLFAALLFAGWSLATPISSAPDEPSHVVKAAATVRGDLTGGPTDATGIEAFTLPRDVSDLGGAMACTAAQPTVPATCQPDLDSFGDDEFAATSGVGSYNPLYYALVGWPSLFLGGDAAVIGMRLVSALVNAFFVGVVAWAAAQMRRGSAVAAWSAVALTPMATYLGGMVNPNGVEVTGCLALAAMAWLIVHDPDGPRLGVRAGALVVAGVVAGNARSASPLFVLLIVVAVLLTVPVRDVGDLLRRRPVWLAAAVAAVGLGAAAAWTVLVAAPAGFIPSSDPARDTLLPAVLHTLAATENYGTEMIGVLGWFDTGLPQPVYYGWTAGVGLVVAGALGFARRRALVGAGLLMVALLLVPSVLQAPSAAAFGYIWQGRYSLPVFVGMVIVAGLAWQHARPSHERWLRLVVVVVSAATVGQVASFATAYRRYSVGVSRPFRDVLEPGSWQAPGGLVAVALVFVVGAVGLGVLGVLVTRAVEAAAAEIPSRADAPASADAPSSVDASPVRADGGEEPAAGTDPALDVAPGRATHAPRA